jgi:hypothetical protein
MIVKLAFAKALTRTHENPMVAFLALAVTLSCVHHKSDKMKVKRDRRRASSIHRVCQYL